ncbi:MAG: hypothetical protein ACREB9_06200 [Thermoplasmata archaeon]
MTAESGRDPQRESETAAKAKATKTLLGEGMGGTGGTPGSGYNWVRARVYRLPSGEYRVDLRASAGDNQGYEEEHYGTTASGWGATVPGAIERARAEGREARMDPGMVAVAIGAARRAIDEAAGA